MELNEYQEKAMTTCMPSCENFSYMMLNLVGELGEFAGKVAKAFIEDNVLFVHQLQHALRLAGIEKDIEL